MDKICHVICQSEKETNVSIVRSHSSFESPIASIDPRFTLYLRGTPWTRRDARLPCSVSIRGAKHDRVAYFSGSRLTNDQFDIESVSRVAEIRSRNSTQTPTPTV